VADNEVELAALIADPKNRRTHGTRNVDMIATALRAVGPARSIVIDEHDTVLAGNGVVAAAHQAGIVRVHVVEAAGDALVAVRRRGLSEAQKRELAMFDNRTAELAEWNVEQLAADQREGLDFAPFFTDEELDAILPATLHRGHADPEDIPPPRTTAIARGDVIALGDHRLYCGDTTRPEAIAQLSGGERCSVLHADPPYGMGKEADGIANDNLHGAHLDAFQMQWWRAWVAVLADNGSAYVWGTAPDLWRWWWRGGLGDEEGLMVRNELVWNKGSAFGMASDLGHSYPPCTERCLFLMRGQQFLGNQNKADYWPGYDPLRTWLVAERDKAGWTNTDVNRITGTHMAGHWFTTSQFHPIAERQYRHLQIAAEGRAFVEPYADLFDRVFGVVREGGNTHRRELSARLREARTFFDNGHDTMTDVWTFPRVVGEERFGHATPKPVAMMIRALRTSSAPGDLVGVPFAGTGPEVIAAVQLGERRVIAAELEPVYCQIVVDRWEAFTGAKARKDGEVVPA
jgi:DNA modification methylase